MINMITAWWRNSCADAIHEHVYADQYEDLQTRQQISQQYQARWQLETTPATDPALYDPLAPPAGWRYDPYYECWTEESS